MFRQAIHFAGGVFFAALFLALGNSPATAALAIIFSIGILVSDAHRKWNGLPFLKTILAGAEREGEAEIPGKAALEFTFGMLITAMIFYSSPPAVLAGAALVLGVGDGASTLIGKRFGKTKIAGGRTLEGSMGGFAAAAVALLPIFPLQAAVFAAAAGMIAEYLPVNDNYSIPLAAAAALALMA